MTTLQASAQAQLRQFIEQIERLEEEKKAIAADIKDKFLEAKSQGFDVKAMRKVIALRKKDADERQEEDAILETYMHALGMTLDLFHTEPAQHAQACVGVQGRVETDDGTVASDDDGLAGGAARDPGKRAPDESPRRLAERGTRKGKVRGKRVDLPESAAE